MPNVDPQSSLWPNAQNCWMDKISTLIQRLSTLAVTLLKGPQWTWPGLPSPPRVHKQSRCQSRVRRSKMLGFFFPRCARCYGASLWCRLWYACSWSPQGVNFADRQSWVWWSQLHCATLGTLLSPSLPPFPHCSSGDDTSSTSRVLLDTSSANTCKMFGVQLVPHQI